MFRLGPGQGVREAGSEHSGAWLGVFCGRCQLSLARKDFGEAATPTIAAQGTWSRGGGAHRQSQQPSCQRRNSRGSSANSPRIHTVWPVTGP